MQIYIHYLETSFPVVMTCEPTVVLGWVYLQQTMSVGYVVLQLFFTFCATCNVISHVKYILHFYISTFRIICAVPNMAYFLSSLVLCFRDTLFHYFLSDFEMASVS